MTDHANCPPELHSRDISAENAADGQESAPVTLTDGRRILVMLCNDCRAPLFYCDADNDYHHLGAGVPACFLVPETSWPLATTGFKCAEYGAPEPS